MKIIYGLKQMKRFKKPVVALGVFDGVHRGHRNILEAAVKKAAGIKGTSTALTFWPHPQKKEIIYSLKHRLKLFEQLGVDAAIVINFNRKFSRITAFDFVKKILIEGIGARYIFVGKNFRFGVHAAGDYNTLKRLAKIFNFRLRFFEVIKAGKMPVSSTLIRSLIKRGRLFEAQKLLTRPVSVLGTVIRGVSLAKKLGFPTANINPHHEVIPPSGVYAVKIIFNARKYLGACYIGERPTFSASRKSPTPKGEGFKNIEVYIFDFRKNIYGKDLEVQFIKKMREEKKFASLASLVEQIKKDISCINKVFSRH